MAPKSGVLDVGPAKSSDDRRLTSSDELDLGVLKLRLLSVGVDIKGFVSEKGSKEMVSSFTAWRGEPGATGIE